jgi:MFS family permease
MTFTQTDKQIKQDFSYSIKDGIFWVLMNSIALTFLIPYIISLGANSFQVGLIQSFPLFITSFLVLISYKILKKFDSKKKSVIFFITLQALMWFPLAVAHFFFNNFLTIWIVILIYTIIVGLGIVIHPIYMDWIRKLFPVKKMGYFIARKNIILELISISPLVLIGFILDRIKDENSLIGFSIIFICAGIFRYISSRYLNKMHKTEDRKEILKLVEIKKKDNLFRSFKKNVSQDKPFLKYIILIIISFFGIYLATTYVTYFVLTALKYTNTQYVFWRIAYILGVVSSLSYWGYISDKYNPIKVLQISTFFLPFFLIVPSLFYNNYLLMIISIFVGGAVFGAFNLSVINYLYKNIKRDLILHSSYFTIIQSTAILVGTLTGALIIKLGTNYFGSEFKALIFLFIIAMFVRLIAFIYSLRLEHLERRDLRFFRYVIFQRPVFYGLLEFTRLSHEEKKLLLDLKLKKEFVKHIFKKEKNN